MKESVKYGSQTLAVTPLKKNSISMSMQFIIQLGTPKGLTVTAVESKVKMSANIPSPWQGEG